MTDILDTATDEQTEMVYLGVTADAKGKQYALWIVASVLEGLEPAAYNAAREKALWYGKKGDTTRTIGGRYLFKTQGRKEDGTTPVSVWFGTARYIGQDAHPLIAAFQADDTQARDMEYRRKNERKASEPVYMRDMERTVEALRALPRRQALDIANAIHIELRNRILAK
jgi:hypothetical protein